MSDRVLVTGGSGFIGRQAIAPLLELGYDVHLLARNAASLGALDPRVRERCAVHLADLLDPAAVERSLAEVRPSHLLHFAWYSDPRLRWTSPENLDWAAATIRLARAFSTNGGRRMVVSGTCAEYDWRFHTLVEDQTPLAPRSMYGASKAAVHRLLATTSSQLGLSFVWGHAFFCYGPGEPEGRLLNEVITGLLDDRRVSCTAGHQVRDYLSTEDMGRAFSLLVHSDFEGTVNVGSGSGVRVRDLVTTAADLLGRRELIQFGDKQLDASEPPCIVADVTRLTRIIGFTPRYDLGTGLSRTIEWFRKRPPGFTQRPEPKA